MSDQDDVSPEAPPEPAKPIPVPAPGQEPRVAFLPLTPAQVQQRAQRKR